jgi:CubicO group peptidase (beta-lactamase class C family)
MAAVLVLGAVAVGCSSDDGDEAKADEPDATTTTAVPSVPGDEWDVVSPEDGGVDAAVLEGAREYAFADGMNTQGVVVVRHGKIVAEWYADGASQDSWAASWSMAKSFTSALVGIAIEEGKIPGVDEPMTTWFPEWEGSPREEITLQDVLQMSSGLDWDENYSPEALGESEVIQMVVGESNELSFAASRPSEVDAGTRWSYSSGDTMLLSGVIEQATGMPTHEYAREKLFEPLALEKADWWQDAAGHTLTYCCLDTTTRGFARFGLLYLNGGAWGGEQLVPEAWVADSVEPAETSDGIYGYQWWMGIDGAPEDTFAALGHDGHFIYVMPSLDLVVVRNGSYVKDPGESIADPNLFGKYPPDGLVEGKGTKPPEGGRWDDAAFLEPIVDAVTD